MLIDLLSSALEESVSLGTAFVCLQLLSAHVLLSITAISDLSSILINAFNCLCFCDKLKPSSSDLISPLKFSERPFLKQWFFFFLVQQGNKTLNAHGLFEKAGRSWSYLPCKPIICSQLCCYVKKLLVRSLVKDFKKVTSIKLVLVYCLYKCIRAHCSVRVINFLSLLPFYRAACIDINRLTACLLPD